MTEYDEIKDCEKNIYIFINEVLREYEAFSFLCRNKDKFLKSFYI